MRSWGRIRVSSVGFPDDLRGIGAAELGVLGPKQGVERISVLPEIKRLVSTSPSSTD
jgi:hypothetical protein